MKEKLHIKPLFPKKHLDRDKDQTTEILNESEEMYRAIVEHSPDAVIVHSWNTLLFANPSTLRMLGADTFEEIRNINFTKFVHPDCTEHVTDTIRRVYETGSPQGFTESRILNLRREVINVEVISIPVTYRGDPAVQTIMRDITARKKVEKELIAAKEKAEISDQLKTAFLHNISHEIRTPMNAIVGFSALLNEPDISVETRDSYLKIIIDSSDQLLAIVNDIIEISNIEVGILKASMNDINLNSQLLAVYRQYSHKATERGIEFKLSTSLTGSKAMIETDSVKLIQILSNLLNNAFKFTRQGRVVFGYTLKEGYLEFYVSDTGIGIHRDQHNKIFERFYQVENSASRAYEGTGLGLSITQAYVELLGGKIWLSSEPGKGSVFYFTIPYKQAKRNFISEMENATGNQGNTNPGKSVLIAEDDDNNFYLMKELLSDMNLNIIRASNGVEAVDAFSSGEKIDLVLMDIKMPIMDGYEATRQILERQPGAKILAQTAYADDEIKAIESGCMGFISKPFIKDRFVNLVKEYL